MNKMKITINFDVNEEDGSFETSWRIKGQVLHYEVLANVFKEILLHEVYSQEKSTFENERFEKEIEFENLINKKNADYNELQSVAHYATERTICYRIKCGKSQLDKPTEYKCPTCKQTLYDIRKDGLFYFCPNCEISHNSKYIIK